MSNRILKKAQLQNMETIAVTIVIMILIVIGLVFFADFSEQTRDLEATRAGQLDALTVLNSATNLQELNCVRYTRPAPSCLDYDRVVELSKLNADDSDTTFSDYYFRFLSYATINVTMYKPDNEVESVIIYERLREDTTTARVQTVHVLVNNDAEKQYYFAELEVTTY